MTIFSFIVGKLFAFDANSGDAMWSMLLSTPHHMFAPKATPSAGKSAAVLLLPKSPESAAENAAASAALWLDSANGKKLRETALPSDVWQTMVLPEDKDSSKDGTSAPSNVLLLVDKVVVIE